MSVKNSYLWALVAAVLLLVVQVLGVLIYALSFFPVVWDDSFVKGLEPNRDAFFYMVFLAASVVFMGGAVKWVLPQLKATEFQRKFRLWVELEAVWCFLMVFCFFKWTTYRYPFWNIIPYENSSWLQPFFCAVAVLAALSKVFFPEVERFYGSFKLKAGQKFPFYYGAVFQVVFAAGVVLLLYIPNPKDVAALSVAWDQWNHLDPIVVWFIKRGSYISYEQTIQLLVAAAVIYIIALFYFIRLWLGSWLWAAIGVLLVLKMGLFSYGAAPCAWVNPGNTFLAHAWDIILFFGLWFVSIRYPKKFYAAAGICGGLLIILWFGSGGLLDARMGDQPMMAPLRVRQFFPFFMGYLVPVFYVFNLLVFMGRKDAQQRLPAVFCIYGLMIFTDYITHPAIGYYGALIVPAVLVLLWWLKRRAASWAALILIVAAGALLTNRILLTYPDIFFQDKGRFAQENSLYEHFDTASSAALVDRLTPSGQKAALLSNFETVVLMQAGRQPLFDQAPVMFSSLNSIGGLRLKTGQQTQALMDSLTQADPLYVFVDARLWTLGPQAAGIGALKGILTYLHDHYGEYDHQGFLVALKHR